MKLMIDIDAVGWNDVVMGYMPASKALLMGVSAEEVIPCKDCKHKCVKGKTTRYHYCEIWKSAVDETDFCSRGERKYG